MEFEFIDQKPLYEVVDVEESWQQTGKAPISTKWVDVDKGNGELRSRWVARQFKTETTDQYYAATPPWETIKLLLSLMASRRKATLQQLLPMLF